MVKKSKLIIQDMVIYFAIIKKRDFKPRIRFQREDRTTY